MYAYLAEVTAEIFRGNEVKGPKKLLRTPEGVRRADVSAILAIEVALRHSATHARSELARLQESRVVTSGAWPISSPPEVSLGLDDDGVQDARPSEPRGRRR